MHFTMMSETCNGTNPHLHQSFWQKPGVLVPRLSAPTDASSSWSFSFVLRRNTGRDNCWSSSGISWKNLIMNAFVMYPRVTSRVHPVCWRWDSWILAIFWPETRKPGLLLPIPSTDPRAGHSYSLASRLTKPTE